MSKDIWYSKYETPKQESRVVWKSGNVVYGGRFDTYYKCFCGPASQFVDLKSVSCWAYIDDFLALEIELEHTRKALEIAKDTIRHADWFLDGDYNVDAKTMHSEIKCAIKGITALEQKDIK